MTETTNTPTPNSVPAQASNFVSRGRAGSAPRGQQRAGGGRGARGDRSRSEFDQATIAVRRVTRVVRGGRRFSFSVVVAAGNRKGKIGLGVGKAADISAAMEKAGNDAKKHMFSLKLTETGSVPHEVLVKYSSARLFLKPAPGRGLAAGSAARIILNLAGVKDVTAKVFSKSKNKLNLARATMRALGHFAG